MRKSRRGVRFGCGVGEEDAGRVEGDIGIILKIIIIISKNQNYLTPVVDSL
jgi:hypothetical protein